MIGAGVIIHPRLPSSSSVIVPKAWLFPSSPHARHPVVTKHGSARLERLKVATVGANQVSLAHRTCIHIIEQGRQMVRVRTKRNQCAQVCRRTELHRARTRRAWIKSVLTAVLDQSLLSQLTGAPCHVCQLEMDGSTNGRGTVPDAGSLFAGSCRSVRKVGNEGDGVLVWGYSNQPCWDRG